MVLSKRPTERKIMLQRARLYNDKLLKPNKTKQVKRPTANKPSTAPLGDVRDSCIRHYWTFLPRVARVARYFINETRFGEILT